MEIKIFQVNPIRENTYVLHDEAHHAIVIDCGCLTPNEDERLQRYIADNRLSVERVLNTHLHLDHAFGNHMLAQTYGVLPEAHQADEFFATHMTDLAAFFGIHDEVHPQALGGYLHDGDVITVGAMGLHVLHTPGHSPGSVCFYAPKEGVLFSGDTLFRSGIGRTDLRGGDYNALIDSIHQKLLPLPPDTAVYCGHGLPTTIGLEKENF